jgi:hypothetical protein
MRSPLRFALAAFAVASLGNAADSEAVTCYVVMDRTENVLYRDVYPPVDMSDAGRAERDALRRRGEFLFFMESEHCPRLEYFTGAAGTVALRLDQTSTPPTDAAGITPKPAPDPAPRPRKPQPKP